MDVCCLWTGLAGWWAGPGEGRVWVGLGICIFNKPHVAILAYLCPWAAAWLNEFMSPWGVVEIPFLYMVPIRGSAPRSSSKLTSSKFPASPERGGEGMQQHSVQVHAGAHAGDSGLPTAAASCRGVSE